MIAPTHVTFAEFVYLLLLTTTGVSLSVVNALLVAVCALLPDIDTAASTAGKVVPFLAVRIERKFGHRTLTHSVPWLAGLAVLGIPLYAIDSDAYICCLTAYASHPFLDTMTVNGVKLFYPFSPVNCVFPLEVNNPHRYRLQTGGRMDKTLAIMFLGGCLPTFLIAHQGYERFIRLTQRNIEAAVRDFNEFSRDHRVRARVEAHDMLTKGYFFDTVEVVGALNAQMLVFRDTAGTLHTLGKEFQADYVADAVVCFAGEPAHAVVQNVDLANRYLFELARLLDSSESFLFGDLTTGDKVSLPENIRLFTPVTGSGSLVRLNYATLDDLRAFGLDNILITKGILTIKTMVTGKGRGGDRAMLGGMGRYGQATFSVAASESVMVLKDPGDSVLPGEPLARKCSPDLIAEQIGLNDEKMRLLRQQEDAAIAAIGQKAAAAQAAELADSGKYAGEVELVRRRYLAPQVLQGSKVAWEKASRAVRDLRSSLAVVREKTSHEINKLLAGTNRLRAQQAAAERDAPLRSTVRGVVVDIRRIRRNDTVQLTFVLKTY